MGTDTPARRALADAEPTVFWLDRPDLPEASPPAAGRVDADLCVVGGAFTGLWAAIQAKERDADRNVVVLEADRVAHGASGRNGGVLDASITHGLVNGVAHFPDEIAHLVALGRESYQGILEALDRYRIDAAFEATGEMVVATDAYQLPALAESVATRRLYGENAVLLDADEVRAEVHSAKLLGGAWQRSNVGLVDPVALALGLRRTAESLGVHIYEQTPATGVRGDGAGVRVDTSGGHVRAAGVLLATNAFPGLVGPIRRAVAPVYDYVLVTEPLDGSRRASIGWASRQGLADSANQFHYFRLTSDDRVLWGGYDAIYYFGGGVGPQHDQRQRTFNLLAEQLFALLPQLEGVRFTHRWGGGRPASVSGSRCRPASVSVSTRDPIWGECEQRPVASPLMGVAACVFDSARQVPLRIRLAGLRSFRRWRSRAAGSQGRGRRGGRS